MGAKKAEIVCSECGDCPFYLVTRIDGTQSFVCDVCFARIYETHVRDWLQVEEIPDPNPCPVCQAIEEGKIRLQE